MENDPLPPGEPELAHSNTTGDKVRAGLTGTAILAWSHVGYLLEIAAGKFVEHEGTNAWITASAVGALATAETLGMSYLAEKGIGDFTAGKSDNKAVRWFQESSVFSLSLSLWNGAPSGVALDRIYDRPVSVPRRLAHSLPYGVAVGLWTTPIKPAEWITGTVAEMPEFVAHEAAHHPAPAAGIGIVVLTAAGVKVRHWWHARHARS